MSSPTIDYDALAAQHGGTPAGVDYDALAAQHGGVAATQPGASAPQQLDPDTRNAVQKAYDHLQGYLGQYQGNPSAVGAAHFVQGALDTLSPLIHPEAALQGIGQTMAHPINSAVAMAKGAAADPVRALGQVGGGLMAGEVASAGAGQLGDLATQAATTLKIPGRLYESALKPSTMLSQADRTAIVNTALDKAIPVSEGGVERLGQLVDNYNQQIKAQIAADPTRPISTVPALRNLDAVRAKFANQVTPQPDLADIGQVKSDFLDNPKIQPSGAGPGPASLPAADAQAMKQGTYQALGGKAYGEVKGASIEAQKALARGLKDEIATQFPEINKLNGQESQLLDLQPVLEKAVNRAGNHQLIGIGAPIAGAAGAAMGGVKTGAAITALKLVLDNPMVKSRLAIAISKGSGVPIAQAIARVGAYQSSLAAAVQDPASYPGGTATGPMSQ